MYPVEFAGACVTDGADAAATPRVLGGGGGGGAVLRGATGASRTADASPNPVDVGATPNTGAGALGAYTTSFVVTCTFGSSGGAFVHPKSVHPPFSSQQSP